MPVIIGAEQNAARAGGWLMLVVFMFVPRADRAGRGYDLRAIAAASVFIPLLCGFNRSQVESNITNFEEDNSREYR
jgi:hypothetical protein